MAMLIASGVSIDDEIIPYLDHKLSKNKWKSKKVSKECRNRQARSNGSDRKHRRQRYCHQSQIARKGVVPSSDCKNLKHKRRLTNDSFINESMLNDIFNTSQSTLEETVNYYTNDDNGQTFIDPKLLVLASPKRRRRKKKSKHHCGNGSVASSSLLGLEDTPSMSVFTASEDSHSSEVDLGYYYVPNDYSKYLETNDNSKNDKSIKYTSKSKSTLVKVNNYDSDSSDDSDDSDNWTPWPSSKPDPKYAAVVPAPPKAAVVPVFNPPAPVKKPKKIVPKDDVDQFPDFNIEEELKLLGLGLEEEKEKVPEAKKDDEQTDKDKEQEKDVSVNTDGNQLDKTTNETDKDKQVEAAVDGDKDKQNEKGEETENESDKKEESKEAEMKEISVLEERYINEIDKIEELNEYAPIEGLASRSSFKEYNKDDETTQMDPKTLKKVFKEIKVELPKNIVIQWNGSMFVRFDEENPRFLQALLTGLDDTPYENGLFLFDIYLHKDYPNSPLKIKHVTKGGNMVYGNHTPGGFSPNLHRDSGKVCLSLLGTWGTNQWDPKTSNIYQVLSSILFWIFGAKWAYYMEPSYGGWELTAPMSENDASKHKKEVITYNYEVIEKCMKYAILETIRTPYTGFDEVTKVHFKVKKNIILQTILTKWIKDAPSIKVKNKLIPLYKDIKEELNKL